MFIRVFFRPFGNETCFAGKPPIYSLMIFPLNPTIEFVDVSTGHSHDWQHGTMHDPTFVKIISIIIPNTIVYYIIY